ncbi:hypothetical protein ACET3Z_010386 [Daucus carota]
MHEYRLDDKECDDSTSGIQDSYALCRVFKKNGICGSELEDQGQLNMVLTEEIPQGILTEYETGSPSNILPSAPSACIEDEDKDDSWMQFIKDDAWCSFNTPILGEETSQVTDAN